MPTIEGDDESVGEVGRQRVPAHVLVARPADSFSAALKDFVPPQAVTITNCGRIEITKTDDAGTALQGAVFTLYKDNAPVGGSRGGEDTITNQTCTTGADGKCTILNVIQGAYWVVETTTPAGHETAADQHASVTPEATVTLTFVDPRQRGAILVTKTPKHAADGPGDHPHAGVDFTVNGVTKTTGSDGKVCFDCAGDPYVGETVSFSNTPLSKITVSFESQVSGGALAKISCTGLTATPPDGNSIDCHESRSGAGDRGPDGHRDRRRGVWR